MGWFTPQEDCGCGCDQPCLATCSDATQQEVNQLTFAMADLDTTVLFMRKSFFGSSGGDDFYIYETLEIDLTAFNASYIVSKDSDCNFPADPVVDQTEVGLSYTYTKYFAVAQDECPGPVDVDTTKTGTVSATMKIYLEWPTYTDYAIVFTTGLVEGDTFQDLFSPTSLPTDPCNAASMQMDTNYSSHDGSLSCGSGAIYNATATPSA